VEPILVAGFCAVVIHRARFFGVFSTAPLALPVEDQHFDLFGPGGNLVAGDLRQKGRQLLGVRLRQRFRKNDVEDDDQTALVERVPVRREAFSHDHLYVAVFDDLSGLRRDDDVTVVERLEDFLQAAQGLREGDVHLRRQVLAVTLVDVVGFFFQLDNDVAGLFARFLVAVAVEEELVFATDALVDIDLRKIELISQICRQSGIYAGDNAAQIVIIIR